MINPKAQKNISLILLLAMLLFGFVSSNWAANIGWNTGWNPIAVSDSKVLNYLVMTFINREFVVVGKEDINGDGYDEYLAVEPARFKEDHAFEDANVFQYGVVFSVLPDGIEKLLTFNEEMIIDRHGEVIDRKRPYYCWLIHHYSQNTLKAFSLGVINKETDSLSEPHTLKWYPIEENYKFWYPDI
jgi:hypothetical protein